jgi:tight adherence protein B
VTALELAAAAVAGLGAALLSGPSPRRLLGSRLGSGARSASSGLGSVGWSWAGAPGVGLGRLGAAGSRRPLAVIAVAGIVAVLQPSSVLLCAAAAMLVGGVGWLCTRTRRRRAVQACRRRTIESCDALVAELRAGQPAVLALARAADHHPLLVPAAGACALGGDVAAALRGAASEPGAGGMHAVAAAWRVADGTGAGLVAVLSRVVEGLRADDSSGADVEAALTPARATARLLAVLPVFGLLLGSGLGGDPVGFLLTTAVGHALLLGGVTLALAGTVWVERIADRVGS